MGAGNHPHAGPQLSHLVAGEAVVDAVPRATLGDQPGMGQRPEVGRGVGDALADLARHLLDRAFPLVEEVHDLGPAAARERLAHLGKGIEELVLGRPRAHGQDGRP